MDRGRPRRRPGELREVVRAPADRSSSTLGETVDPTAPDVVRLAADLVATMRVSPGCVGLAAPQVGVGAKVFCVDVSEHPKTRDHHGTFVLCNAEVARGEPQREGARGLHERPRPHRRREAGDPLVVRGQLPGTGEEVELEADAFEARALQHEIDHCTGCCSSTASPARTPSTSARRTYDLMLPGRRPGIPTGRGSGLKTAQCGFDPQPGHS